MINERLINCPPQLAPPLVQALFDEIQWATEDMKEVRHDIHMEHTWQQEHSSNGLDVTAGLGACYML